MLRMQIFLHLDELPLSLRESGSSCAMGMFDGLHMGHRKVLESALHQAQTLQIPSIVFSFSNHPQFLLSKTPPELLSSLNERLEGLKALGFDHALILDFDEDLKNRSAMDFVRTLLLNHLNVKNVSVGYDHCFGANRQGDGDFLKRSGQEFNFKVQIIEPVQVTYPAHNNQQIVSSTLIRKLLRYGQIHHANTLLGYPYPLSGSVGFGEKRGRTLGFPTANLDVEKYRLVPAIGTYSGIATLKNKPYIAVCNIGHAPTFGDQPLKRVEIHLLDYSGDEFYGEPLTLNFHHFLRDEKKFKSADELVTQIKLDCDQARNHLQSALLT